MMTTYHVSLRDNAQDTLRGIQADRKNRLEQEARARQSDIDAMEAFNAAKLERMEQEQA